MGGNFLSTSRNQECNICTNEKPAMDFQKLSVCKHTACNECLGKVFRLAVSNGTHPCCPFCRTRVSPRDLGNFGGSALLPNYGSLSFLFNFLNFRDRVPVLETCRRCGSEMDSGIAYPCNHVTKICRICEGRYDMTRKCHVCNMKSVFKIGRSQNPGACYLRASNI